MNEYELMYVLHPRLTAEELDAAVERISALVSGPGGQVLSVDRWGRRRLAYPIDRNLEGYYVLSTFRASPEICQPLENQLNLSEDVLRHLLIRGIIPYEEPPRDERVAADRERPSRPPRDDDRRPRDDDGDDDNDDDEATEDAPVAVAAAPVAAAPVEAAAPVAAAPAEATAPTDE